MTSIPKGIAKLLTSGPVTNPKTGTRATAIANNDYVAKIVLQGKNNPQGWGGLRTLRGTVEQMKTTFKYLNKSVNENCNTITVLDGLEEHLFKLFPNLRNKFAQIRR